MTTAAGSEPIGGVGVPALVRDRFRGRDWIPITHGRSGAGVWRLHGDPSLYLKVVRHAPDQAGRGDVAGEAERLSWLRGNGIPTADVVEVGTDDLTSWLLMTAVAGRCAADPWTERQRDGVIDAIADITRTLHALPIAGCPFDRRLAVSLPQARQAAVCGRVDLDDLDRDRRGWTVTRLLEELEITCPSTEEPVVCHGDLCLPNVLVDPDSLTVTGLIDVGRLGVADRYHDLAIATRSMTSVLNPRFGPSCADRFLARYGETTLDARRLEFYRLLDEFF